MKKEIISKTAVITVLMFVAATFSIYAKPQKASVSKTTTVVTTTTTTTTTTSPVKNTSSGNSKKKYPSRPYVHHDVNHHSISKYGKRNTSQCPPCAAKVLPEHYEPPRHPEPQKKEVIIVEPGSKTAQKAATVAVVAAGVATVASIAALLAD